ncbi:Phosphate-binding protein PstS 1 [subsurface metagenome]
MRYLAILCMISLLACNQREGGIIIAGSTSIQPFIEKVAEHYMEKHPEIQINVQGGGSTAGVQATYNKICDIGISSRNLKVNEKGLKVIVIAIDGIAVIVHKDNPVNNLSTEQIRGIFSGEIENWQDLGGRDKEIISVTREEGSGTRGSFEDMIMGDEVISDACLVQDSNGSVREIIATTPQGIGYISVGLVDEREKAVAINGVLPTLENIASRKYRFSRPFLFLLLTEPQGNVRKFIDYVLSKEGQDILKKDGLIPATEIYND